MACEVDARAASWIKSRVWGDAPDGAKRKGRAARCASAMPPFDLVAPRTTDEAIAEIRSSSAEDVVLLAGGTDLLFDLESGRARPRKVVSLRRLPWRTLDWNGPTLVIGSTLPLRSLELDPDLPRRLPALHQAIQAVGSVALRHRATIGGNLGRAAPSSDLVPVLLALDAQVDLVGPNGSRKMPVDQFVRASRSTALVRAELIRSVTIPEMRPSAYLWQRVRPANDISQVSVTVAYSPSRGGWRVAIGGVPPRPTLVPEAEAHLLGPRPPVEAIRKAADEVARHGALVADRRASDLYRRQLGGVLLVRALERATGTGGPP
jgi:CO/xanthine dehydrogenase FAD-binding subunit